MTPELLSALPLVTATLVTLAGLSVLLGVLWLLTRLIPPPPPAIEATRAPAPQAVSTPTVEPEEPALNDPVLIAIITAAATVALGRSARVTRLTFTQRQSTTWAQFGRADIHQSHRLR
jgi:hypothetical protein